MNLAVGPVSETCVGAGLVLALCSVDGGILVWRSILLSESAPFYGFAIQNFHIGEKSFKGGSRARVAFLKGVSLDTELIYECGRLYSS